MMASPRMDHQQAVLAVTLRLDELAAKLNRRDSLVSSVYGFLLLTAAAMVVLFPFPLSRIGSVLLCAGFLYALCRFRQARGRAAVATRDVPEHLINERLRLARQIELARSVLLNVPVFVGANLFWMGLPGTSTAFEKAVLDLFFLAGSTIIFCASYLWSQQTIRKHLLPLKRDVERVLNPP